MNRNIRGCTGFLVASTLLCLGCSEEKQHYINVESLVIKIAQGHGSERPFLSTEDNMTLLLKCLKDPYEHVRWDAAGYLSTSHTSPRGTEYLLIIDAYMDANRGPEVVAALRDQYLQAREDSREKRQAIVSFMEAKVRLYALAHPDVRKELKLVRLAGRSYNIICKNDDKFEAVVDRMIAEGDTDMANARRAWDTIDVLRGDVRP